jgi:hypothetical protein
LTAQHKVHLVIQGKGGVGKTTAATFLAQRLTRDDPTRVTCIDTDAFNATFTAYKWFGVHRVDIMAPTEGEDPDAPARIDPRRFDEVIELIMAGERDVVIDNGASSFVALAHYMLTTQIPELLQENGRELVLHVSVVGGPSARDTLHGLKALVGQFPDPCKFVVWLNPFYGPVTYQGKSFEDLKVYQDHRARISALIRLPTLQPDTFGADLSVMLAARRTFNEAIADMTTGIVTRQRLKLVRQRIFDQLDAAADAGIL